MYIPKKKNGLIAPGESSRPFAFLRNLNCFQWILWLQFLSRKYGWNRCTQIRGGRREEEKHILLIIHYRLKYNLLSKAICIACISKADDFNLLGRLLINLNVYIFIYMYMSFLGRITFVILFQLINTILISNNSADNVQMNCK